MKVRLKEYRSSCILFETFDKELITFFCTDVQQKEMESLARFLHIDAVFNLVNVRKSDSEQLEADFLILEPDYLVDISSLSECFRSYGNHPLNYTLSRLRNSQNSKHILLGNAANFFMDELVYETDEFPVDYFSVLKKLFQQSPFEITACEDLKDPDTEVAFFADCKRQFENIRHIIRDSFSKQFLDREKAIIEPSFICNTLGLQGRLDLLLDDFSAFVELKSGKGVENFHAGGIFTHSARNHYIQMMLYLAVLKTNLQLRSEEIRSYLLYSKYPILSLELQSTVQLQQALSLRNSIVALEYDIQHKNNSEYTSQLLGYVRSSVINTAQMTGNFFENYLRPSIDQFPKMINQLNDLEQMYFMRLYTFIVKELWLSKVGQREYEGLRRAANLWNASFQEKLEAGEILFDLQMIENQSGNERHFVTLNIPVSEEVYLPNFRNGDAVVLYERNKIDDNVNNKQVFRGAIDFINTEKISIRLRSRQRNQAILTLDSLYALEHDYMDGTYTGMFRALAVFTEANQDRKDLLLGQRMPHFSTLLSAEEHLNAIQQIVVRALAADDCFLLIGPPGTGKTSLALKQMVEKFLITTDGNVLLLAYTNRAVDEICKTLMSINEAGNFIRIGSELNCALEYRDYLLDRQLDHCTRRTEVNSIICRCRIIVGTVASVWNKPELFKLKQFNLAIVDEATQLLEPHLLGILCSKTQKGENAVERFILIGDHKQLPAVILQSKEESKVCQIELNNIGLVNLSNSLFERMYFFFKKNNEEKAYDTLYFQGRMHPEIATFPSLMFYDGQLKPVGLPHQIESWEKKEEKEKMISATVLVEQYRLAFVPVTGVKMISPKISMEEATVVAQLTQALFDSYRKNGKNFTEDTLGIITPYRSQIALIRKSLHNTGIEALNRVLVDTVERFQGSQKEVIIYSFCVNTMWQLESLPSLMEEDGQIIDRKLNVVLTRAKKQLFITGNPKFLVQNQIYSDLINHIRKEGIVCEKLN